MHRNTETSIPADLLLVRGSANVVKFSHESTPLQKEPIELWRRMHVLTLTERTKTLCYLAIPRSCNRARESTRPQSRRLSIFNYIFIVSMYVIYIYSIIFYFFTGCARTQPLARRGQRTVALVHYRRERRAVGGSARRSA